VASTAPSQRVTRPCTIDCGDQHVDPLVGISNRWCASITSSPLFISVAESIVIFAPIDHVGWVSACSALTCSRRSRV